MIQNPFNFGHLAYSLRKIRSHLTVYLVLLPCGQEVNSLVKDRRIRSSFPSSLAKDKGGVNDDRGTQHGSRSIYGVIVLD